MYQYNNPIPNHVLWPGWVDPHATLMAESTGMQLCPYQASEEDLDKKGKGKNPLLISLPLSLNAVTNKINNPD